MDSLKHTNHTVSTKENVTNKFKLSEGDVDYRFKLSEEKLKGFVTTKKQPMEIAAVEIQRMNKERKTPVVERIKYLHEEDVKIQNYVVTAKLNVALVLSLLARDIKNVEFNPQKFAAAILRFKNPSSTILLFPTGKLVCTGTKAKDFALNAVTQCLELVKKNGYPTAFLTDFRVENIVANVDLLKDYKVNGECFHGINLTKLSTRSDIEAVYEPEIFPGLSFKINRTGLTCLVFTSGNIVITGGRYEDDIYEFYTLVKDIITPYIVQSTMTTERKHQVHYKKIMKDVIAKVLPKLKH